MTKRIAMMALGLAAVWISPAFGQMQVGPAMSHYHEVLGLDHNSAHSQFDVVLLSANGPGCIFYPGQTPRLTFQVQNRTAQPIVREGRIDLIQYGTRGVSGDIWKPEVFLIQRLPSRPVKLNVAANGFQNITLDLPLPATFGGYAAVLDLGKLGRARLATMVRAMEPHVGRVQFPRQLLDPIDPEVLDRLGVHAVRMEVGFVSPTSPRYEAALAELNQRLDRYHQFGVTVAMQFGAGTARQPLDMPRPHLDEHDQMLDGKSDSAWLPSEDQHFSDFVRTIITRNGWPKGPVTAALLWNEPWEGSSISGWQADMLRYRALYKNLALTIRQTCKDQGVQVLVGGCDSSSNAWDKLFADGSDEFLPIFDFCSVHYQGMLAPSLYSRWRNRTGPHGRVRIWDTESWVANTDDRFAGVVATDRAAGYERSLGIFMGNVTTFRHQVGWPVAPVFDAAGHKSKQRIAIEAWPPAAVVCAVQAFIGERDFDQILFQNGLPWVYLFHGLNDNPDDGTVVVLGDLGELFAEPDQMLFRGVRSQAELRAKRALRAERAGASPERQSEIEAELERPMPFTGATMSVEAADRYALYDFYGNRVPAEGGRYVIPLDSRGFFLRADPALPGSFARLVAAIRAARIEGIEPLDLVAHDFTSPIDTHSQLYLTLTNVLNRPVEGMLHARLGHVELSPQPVRLKAGATIDLPLAVEGLTPTPDNRYPLEVTFHSDEAGDAEMTDTLHVNQIAHRTIQVDGKLGDWAGALPQVITSASQEKQTLTEAAWLPFVPFQAGKTGGFATAYLAYDDQYFYFAAKIADTTPDAGTLRFATRDDDADFYPERVTVIDRKRSSYADVWDLNKRWGQDVPQRDYPLGIGQAPQRVRAGFHPGTERMEIELDLPSDQLTQVTLYYLLNPVVNQTRLFTMDAFDRDTGRKLFGRRRDELTKRSAYERFVASGKVRLAIGPIAREGVIGGIFLDPAPLPDILRDEMVRIETTDLQFQWRDRIEQAAPAKRPDLIDRLKAEAEKRARKTLEDHGSRVAMLMPDETHEGDWHGTYGKLGVLMPGQAGHFASGYDVRIVNRRIERTLHWPAGVRRFSYRRRPALPAGNAPAIDNVQLAFDAVPLDQERDWITHLPGRPIGFVVSKDTDYEYALNTVSPAYGGGFEVWRLLAPGMVRKHFYPRQPRQPQDGAVAGAKLITIYINGTRITEAAIPWSELPHVRRLLDQSQPVKFSFKVNDNAGSDVLELARGRSASRRNNRSFHVDWRASWAPTCAFGWESSKGVP